MAGRPKSPNETVKVHPTVSTQIVDFFSDLIAIGTYGNSDAEVAAYLIQRGIDDLLRAGVLKPKPKPANQPTPKPTTARQGS